MDKTARGVFVQFVWRSMPLDTDARRCIVSARRGSHISCCARRIGAIRIARRPSSRACGRTPGGARRSQGGAGRPGSPGGRSRRSALVRNGDRLTHVGKTASGPNGATGNRAAMAVRDVRGAAGRVEIGSLADVRLRTGSPVSTGAALGLRRQRRNPALGRIDNLRGARADALHGQEYRVVGAGDVALGPALQTPVPSSSAARAASSSVRCAAVKNSWVAYLADRCNGVSVSSVQMPCRSSSPQGVVNAVVEATGT